VTVLGGYLVIQGNTEIGVIVAFISGLERLAGPFRSIIGLYSEISYARTRYQMLLDAMPAHERPAASG
jgi:ABC-type bacteriocin/lantibiotic exporter with double-glycine peptidase domain